RPIHRVERETEHGAGRANERIGHDAYQSEQRPHERIFETVPHEGSGPTRRSAPTFVGAFVRAAPAFVGADRRVRPSSHVRKRSGCSTPNTSGTDAMGRSPSAQALNRTASFSVVRMIAERAACAAAPMRLTSWALNGW